MQSADIQQLRWNSLNFENIRMAQQQISNKIIEQNFVVSKELGNKLTQLQNDIATFKHKIIVCSVCKSDQHAKSPMLINETWGYDSCYDTDNHKLTLCLSCYDIFYTNSELGQYIKQTKLSDKCVVAPCKFVQLGESDVFWRKHNFSNMYDSYKIHLCSEMTKVQKEILDYLMANNFAVSNDVKTAFEELTNDIKECNTSTCHICDHKRYDGCSWTGWGEDEHIHMEMKKDYEMTDHLVMCCSCYKKHIMKSDLGKYVEVTKR